MSEEAEGAWGVHEGDLDGVGELGNDRALAEEVEEAFADAVGQWCDEDTERRHLRRQQEERQRVAVVVIMVNADKFDVGNVENVEEVVVEE